jgi:DNA polymerase elongation subunit (family B)
MQENTLKDFKGWINKRSLKTPHGVCEKLAFGAEEMTGAPAAKPEIARLRKITSSYRVQAGMFVPSAENVIEFSRNLTGSEASVKYMRNVCNRYLSARLKANLGLETKCRGLTPATIARICYEMRAAFDCELDIAESFLIRDQPDVQDNFAAAIAVAVETHQRTPRIRCPRKPKMIGTVAAVPIALDKNDAETQTESELSSASSESEHTFSDVSCQCEPEKRPLEFSTAEDVPASEKAAIPVADLDDFPVYAAVAFELPEARPAKMNMSLYNSYLAHEGDDSESEDDLFAGFQADVEDESATIEDFVLPVISEWPMTTYKKLCAANRQPCTAVLQLAAQWQTADNVTVAKEPEQFADIVPAAYEATSPGIPTEGLKTQGISIPLMANKIVSAFDTSLKYTDVFVLGGHIYAITDGPDVYMMDAKSKALDQYRTYVTPSANDKCISDKIARQLADIYIAKAPLQIVAPKDYAIVSYDIETFWYDGCNDRRGIQLPSNITECGIGMINACMRTYSGKGLNMIMFYCDTIRYPERKVNAAAIIAKLDAELNTPDAKFKTVIESFDSQMALVQQFKSILDAISKRFGLVYAMSFNGSSKMNNGSYAAKDAGKTNGFDLPFILYRSGVADCLQASASSAFKPRKSKDKTRVQLPAQTTIVNYFGPRVHFVDLFSVMCAKKDGFILSKKFKIHPQGMNLNSFLEAAGLPPKDDVDASLIGDCLRTMEPSAKCPYDYATIAKYCVRDCEALLDLNEKCCVISDIAALREVTQLPISAVAHRTDATIASSYFISMAHKNTPHLCTMYTRDELKAYVSKAKSKGASDADVLAKLQEHHYMGTLEELAADTHSSFKGGFNGKRKGAVKYTHTILSQDYKSLYPSVILAFLISPWNFAGIVDADDPNDPDHIYLKSDSENDHSADFTDEQRARSEIDCKFIIGDAALGKGVKYLKFAINFPKDSLAASFFNTMSGLFGSRADYAGKMKKAPSPDEWARYNSLQLAVKLLMNSTYGGLGSDFSPLYTCYGIGAAVTLMGRFCCLSALKKIIEVANPIFADTDSVFTTSAAFPKLMPEGAPEGIIAQIRDGDPDGVAAMITAKAEKIQQFTGNPVKYRLEDGKWLDAKAYMMWAESHADRVVDNIRKSISAEYPKALMTYDGRPTISMPFEDSKMISLAYFPECKKSYAYLHHDDGKFVLKSTGIKFSQASKYVISRTRDIVLQALTCDGPADKIMESFMQNELERISANLIDYSQLHKLDTVHMRNVFARFQEYAANDRKVRIVPCLNLPPPDNKRWVPIDEFAKPDNKYVPDVAKMFRLNFVSNLGKFWKHLTTVYNKQFPKSKVVVYNHEIVMPDEDVNGIVVIKETKGAEKSFRNTPEDYSIDRIAKALISCPKDVTYHEQIRGKIRLTFDLDTTYEEPIPIAVARETAEKSVRALCAIINQMTPKIAPPVVMYACSEHKSSAHVLFPIVATRTHNALIAQMINDELPCVDTAIYANRHTLRLPLCNKICKDYISYRPFMCRGGRNATIAAVKSGSAFMTHLHDENGRDLPELVTLLDLPHGIDESLRGPFHEAMEVFMEVGADLPEFIATVITSLYEGSTMGDFEVKNKVYYFLLQHMNRALACPFCDKVHTNEHIKVWRTTEKNWRVNCYACITGRTKEPKRQMIELADDTENKMTEEKVAEIIAKLNPLPPSNLPKYVTYDATEQDITVVRGSLGCGKTGCFIRTHEKYGSVLLISPRRSFSDDMMARLKEIGFEDYRAIRGVIDMSKHPRVIIQIDSLPRVVFGNGIPVDTILLDEFMGTLEQLRTVAEHSHPRIADIFCSVVRKAGRALVLDAFITNYAIEIVRRIRGSPEPPKVIEFNKRPYNGKTIRVIVDNPNSKAFSTHVLYGMLEQSQHGPIVAYCARVEDAKVIYKGFMENGKRAIIYDGLDLDNMADGKSMYEHKQKELSQIRETLHKVRPDLMIYTNCITVGIDIDLEGDFQFASEYHFVDAHVYSLNQAQALRRNRHTTTGLFTIVISSATGCHSKFDLAHKKTLDLYRMNLTKTTMGSQLLGALAQSAADMAKRWWVVILDILYFAGAAFVMLMSYKDSVALDIDKSPTKRDRVKELVDAYITVDEEERLRDILSQNAEKASASKMGEMPDAFETKKLKFLIARYFGMTCEQVNALTPKEMYAAHHIHKHHHDQDLNIDIRNERTHEAKLVRLRYYEAGCNPRTDGVEWEDVVNFGIENTYERLDAAVQQSKRQANTECFVVARAQSIHEMIVARSNTSAKAAINIEKMKAINDAIKILLVLEEKRGGIWVVKACKRFEAVRKVRELLALIGIIFVPITADSGIDTDGHKYYRVYDQETQQEYRDNETAIRQQVDGPHEIVRDEVVDHSAKIKELVPTHEKIAKDTFPNGITIESATEALTKCKTYAERGRMAFKAIVTALTTLPPEPAREIREMVYRNIHSDVKHVDSITATLYKEMNVHKIPETEKWRIYRKPRQVGDEVRKLKAQNVTECSPTDVSKYMAKVEQIKAFAHDFLTTENITEAHVNAVLFLCGMRFNEATRARIERNANGVWWEYHGVVKGHNEKPFPFVSIIDGEMASKLVAKLAKRMDADGLHDVPPEKFRTSFGRYIKRNWAVRSNKPGNKKCDLCGLPRKAAGKIIGEMVLPMLYPGKTEYTDFERTRAMLIVLHKAISPEMTINIGTYENVSYVALNDVYEPMDATGKPPKPKRGRNNNATAMVSIPVPDPAPTTPPTDAPVDPTLV